MDKNADIYRTEKEKQERRLEAVLLARLESSNAVPLYHLDFKAIKDRAFARLKNKKDSRKSGI